MMLVPSDNETNEILSTLVDDLEDYLEEVSEKAVKEEKYKPRINISGFCQFIKNRNTVVNDPSAIAAVVQNPVFVNMYLASRKEEVYEKIHEILGPTPSEQLYDHLLTRSFSYSKNDDKDL